MSQLDFESIHNHHERLVFEQVMALHAKYANNANTARAIEERHLADVACVALNQLLPRYIRHDVDFSFYLTEAERVNNDRLMRDSVKKAWEFVLERKRVR